MRSSFVIVKNELKDIIILDIVKRWTRTISFDGNPRYLPAIHLKLKASENSNSTSNSEGNGLSTYNQLINAWKLKITIHNFQLSRFLMWWFSVFSNVCNSRQKISSERWDIKVMIIHRSKTEFLDTILNETLKLYKKTK